jgi:pimeloyl-ACP methyl ester carboxylesterase
MDEGLAPGVGVELRWRAAGPPDGPPVVLVHGLAGSLEDWAGALEALAGAGARALAYDRRGYGGSSAPTPYTGTTVEEQAEDLAALLAALGVGPAVVAGRDMGALVALDLAKRHPARVRALVLAAPPLYAFVPEAAEVLAGERARLQDDVRSGGPGDAVAAWLGPRADPAAVARARDSALAFFADYAGQATWPVTRRELRGYALPAVVVTAPGDPAHVVAAADRLAELLPQARRAADGDPVGAAARLLGPPGAGPGQGAGGEG